MMFIHDGKTDTLLKVILKIQLLLLPVALLLAGCGHFAMASKLKSISPGMSKSEVTSLLGSPEGTASGPGYEDITYSFNKSVWDFKMPELYVVRLINGKVDRFGSRKEMELLYHTSDGGKTAPKADLYTEITKLDELRKKGLITDAEYADQKEKLLKRN